MMPASAPERLVEQGRLWPQVTARAFARRLPAGLDLADLEGAGYLGLCRAAKSYDASRGVKFCTYAITMIRGAILEQMRSWDEYSRTAREKAKRTGEQLPIAISLESSIAMASGGSSAELRYADVLQDEEDGPETLALRSAALESLAAAVERLPEREREVIRRYYFEEQTLAAIGAVLEVSESRAYQLRGQGLDRLTKDGALRDAVLG